MDHDVKVGSPHRIRTRNAAADGSAYMRPIGVLVCVHAEPQRRRLVRGLARFHDLAVLGSATCLHDCLPIAEAKEPDVLLVDARLIEGGRTLAERLRLGGSDARTIYLAEGDERWIAADLAYGRADGAVDMNLDCRHLSAVILAAMGGGLSGDAAVSGACPAAVEPHRPQRA